MSPGCGKFHNLDSPYPKHDLHVCIPKLVTNGLEVFKKKFICKRTAHDGQRKTPNDGQRPTAIGHGSDS